MLSYVGYTLYADGSRTQRFSVEGDNLPDGSVEAIRSIAIGCARLGGRSIVIERTDTNTGATTVEYVVSP